MTRNLAVELAPLVRVNAIGVGGVATKSLEVVLTDENLRREFDANTPMKRPGTPEDIAAAALYFASPASSWVTGKLLHVDGGTERPSVDVPAPPLSRAESRSVSGPGPVRRCAYQPDARRQGCRCARPLRGGLRRP